MAKTILAVIMGGPSREHEVSVKSGLAVMQALPRDRYEAIKVFISLTGSWSINEAKPVTSTEALDQLVKAGVDAVFLALHGSFGEDGTIQALLEAYGLPYTGSGVAASLLAMDKVIAGELFTANGLHTPRSLSLSRYELVRQNDNLNQLEGFSYPVIVKPAQQGSSVGVTLVASPDDLAQAIAFALEHDNQVIVQEYIQGREVSCGVLAAANGELQALPPTELKPVGSDIFDYYAKYTAGATNEITPPDMPGKTIEQIQAAAMQAHQLLGCEGYSRTDMILRGKELFIIETNTLPGLTETSILPQQAAAAGLSFSDLLERIITSTTRKAYND